MAENYSSVSKIPQLFCVFLADDDPDDRFLFEMSFRKHLPNCDFYPFDNGQDLLASLASTPLRPDVIVLDLNMPLLNGAETYKLLQQHPDWSRIPAVILTGSEDRDHLAKLHEIDLNRWHVKSGFLPELAETVVQYVSQKK